MGPSIISKDFMVLAYIVFIEKHRVMDEYTNYTHTQTDTSAIGLAIAGHLQSA